MAVPQKNTQFETVVDRESWYGKGRGCTFERNIYVSVTGRGASTFAPEEVPNLLGFDLHFFHRAKVVVGS